jgi:hypothetical protein
MKKIFLLAALFAALFTVTSASAQGGPGADPQQMRQRMIERLKQPLIEKTKITEAEADKVMEINFATMQQRRDIRMDNSLSEEEKGKKLAAIADETSKKYKAIPLKDEQVKAVNEFFEEMRKNQMNRRPQGGGGQ